MRSLFLRRLLLGVSLVLFGALMAWLPPIGILLILAGMVFIGALSMRPRWVLIVLLLLRSSADVAQSVFSLFPGRWYGLNVTGLFNVLAVGIGLLLLVRRFARGQDGLPSAPMKIYAAFLILAALGIAHSIDAAASIKEWSRLAGSLGIALLVLEVVQSEADVVQVLRVTTLAAVPALLSGYYQAATGTGYYFEGWVGTEFVFRPQGTFGHPAILASFMLLASILTLAAFALAYHFWPKLILLALAAVCLGLLLLTFSRTEWFGAMLAFGLLALLRYRRLFVIGIIAILIVVLTVPSVQARLRGENASESFDWRLEVWDASLEILEHPTWIGTGLDTSPLLINKLLPRVTSPPHNDYLKVTIETGIAGAIIFGLLQVSLLGLGWGTYRHADKTQTLLGLVLFVVTAGGLVISLADNYLSYTSVQWYYWVLVALCVRARERYQPATRHLIGRIR
ncbi:MAG: O-antigen ligase family protein [Anaerolineales bacterium]|nr:O-antigen ligase family protein [Anaerolineales bacterium]